VTGGSQAYFDGVIARPFETKLGIEAGNAVDIASGESQEVGDLGNGILRQVANFLLYLLEDGYQTFFVSLERFEDWRQSFMHLFCRRPPQLFSTKR